MSRVLATVLRCFSPCRSPSPKSAAVHPSLRILFFLVVFVILLFCCISMLSSDAERHYLYRDSSQQPNKVNTDDNPSRSRSRSFHFVDGPAVPLGEYHSGIDSASDEVLRLLVKSGSTSTPTGEELGPGGDGLRSPTQPKNNSTNTHIILGILYLLCSRIQCDSLYRFYHIVTVKMIANGFSF